jgi:hypothetical protein
MSTERSVTDEIVEEVHAARKRIAEECGYDFKKLVERYQRMQSQEPPGRLVNRAPKTVSEPSAG